MKERNNLFGENNKKKGIEILNLTKMKEIQQEIRD